MPDPTNDIDALERSLMKAREDYGWFITGDQAKDFSRALTALVAERDALKSQVLELAWKLDGEQENRNALKRRVDELEDEQVEADRGLRERLVCAALPVMLEDWNNCAPKDRPDLSWCMQFAVEAADATLAAMRKGDANA